MIKTILKGGLGNQMFQYAAAKSLAIDNNAELFIDLSFLKNRLPIKDFTIRDYELDIFNISDPVGTLFNNDFLDKYASYPFYYFYNRYLSSDSYIAEPNYYAYDPNFHKLGQNVTIEGYFNNPKYFLKNEAKINEVFNPDKLYDPKFEKVESEIRNSNSVSINIRRGDYLNNKHKDIFVYLDKDYYSEAISIIRDKQPNSHFYVFSYDDPEWFESTFNMDKSEYTMIGKEYIGDRFKTYLRLISLCKHNIISNSTFAWWGAYLNKNPEKIIITPKKWMYKYDFDVLPSWITIDNK